MRFLLLDTLRKFGGVVTHRFLERNFEFERYLLTFFIFLGLGRCQHILHGALLDLLPDSITNFTSYLMLTKLQIVDHVKRAAFHGGIHIFVRNCLFLFHNAQTNRISLAHEQQDVAWKGNFLLRNPEASRDSAALK